MQDSVAPSTCYYERPGRWVAEADWPSPRIQHRKLALNADRTLAEAPNGGTLGICSPLWVGLNAGEVGRYGEDADWPGDQREDDGGSLVFLSDPLPEATEILGAPKVHLTFASDKPQALVAVRLNDVMPDGRSTRVCVGVLNLTHRDSHEHATALEPGKVYTATVELDDIAHHFPAGHRIAVALSTCYYPMLWPSPELATLTITCGSSTLELPVRPPDPQDSALRAFDPAEEAPDTPAIAHPDPENAKRQITRDLLSGEMAVDYPRWTYAKEMPDIDQLHISTGVCRHEIVDGDPLSAVTITDNRVEIRRPDATIVHHSKGTMRCDATHFIVDMDLRLTEDGREVFSKSWHERIPRDMV
jgi:predicted acyl esterase